MQDMSPLQLRQPHDCPHPEWMPGSPDPWTFSLGGTIEYSIVYSTISILMLAPQTGSMPISLVHASDSPPATLPVDITTSTARPDMVLIPGSNITIF